MAIETFSPTQILASIVLAFAIFGYGLRILFGYIMLKRRRREFQDLFTTYDKRLKDLVERQQNLDLAYVTNKPVQNDPTRDLIRRDLVGIHRGTEAISNHLMTCQHKARAASWHSIALIEEVLQLISREALFTSDFPGAWQSTEVRPNKLYLADFIHLLEQRFATTAKRLEKLETPTEFLFPPKTIETLLARADDLGIPHTTLADHPLYLNGRVDPEAYKKLNAQRVTEPETYLNRLEALQKKESGIVQRFAQLEAAIATLNHLYRGFAKDFPEPILAAAQNLYTSHLGNPTVKADLYRTQLCESRSTEEINRLTSELTSFYQEIRWGLKLPTELMVAEVEARKTRFTNVIQRVNDLMYRRIGTRKPFSEHGYLCQKAKLLDDRATDSVRRTKMLFEKGDYCGALAAGLETRLLCDQTDKAYAEAELSIKNPTPTEQTSSFE